MISINWVKDYLDLEGEDLNELATKITKAGVNVESVISNHIDNLVVGYVEECYPHPDSDHLNICRVNVGTDIRQIVCGAPNVKAGIKVIVALPGCKLPEGEIRDGKIRGEESHGMLCALCEIGLEENTPENYSKGIEILDNDAPVGVNAIEYLGLDDTIYELDVHKHRNNDCYYHIGFAYEIGTIINKKVKLPDSDYKEIKDDVNNYIKLDVETDKCPFYLGKMVKNVTIKESPEWIKKRIIAAGMRPINNVVDISNFVMLEYGQPTHFFDADKLGGHVLVRNAKDGEKIVTLDEKERVLTSDDIVITDGENPTCIAGVMGAERVEVDENTKNIFIEAAIFNAINIRNTSEKLNLKSEASIRYGKGLNYEYTIEAMNRCCHLLEKYADGEVCTGVVLHDKVDKTPKVVTFTAEAVNKLLGIKISTDDMKVELGRLDFPYELNKDVFTVTIPNRRLDIENNVADMAEEIGRLYGYHNLKSTLPLVEDRKGEYVGDVKIRKSISRRLRTLGLNESKSYTLVSPDMIKLFKYDNKENKELPNPMSVDKSFIRTTILPSLLNIYDYNKTRKVNDINLYENSKTYDVDYNEVSKIAILMSGNYITSDWNKNIIKVDFYVIKGIIENLLNYLGFKNRYSFVKESIDSLHPGISAKIMLDNECVGIIGKVHPSITKDDIYVSEINMNILYNASIKPLRYKESSKYPSVTKDVAFIVDNNISSDEILKEIRKSAGRLLNSVKVFDLYEKGNGKKSLAYSLTYSLEDRTLTEEEVMESFNKVIENVNKKYNATQN